MTRRQSVSTEYGPVTVFWKVREGFPVVTRVLLPVDGKASLSLFPDSVFSTCSEVENVLAGIKNLLLGKPAVFHLSSIDLDICSKFQRRVLIAEYATPRGCVSTYNLIAKQLGVSGGARAVGNALARNPFPLVIPCHRTVRSDGTIGGFQGGEKMKRQLLESEGITFDERGRINRSRMHCTSASYHVKGS